MLNEPQPRGDTRAAQVESAQRLNDWHVNAARWRRGIGCRFSSFSRGTWKTRKHDGDGD
jgi:hypothetical protein